MGFIIDIPLGRSSGTSGLANVFATKNKIKYQRHNVFSKRCYCPYMAKRLESSGFDWTMWAWTMSVLQVSIRD